MQMVTVVVMVKAIMEMKRNENTIRNVNCRLYFYFPLHKMKNICK